MSTLQATAGFLAWFRQPGRNIPICAAEALLLIGGGVDSVPELQAQMRTCPATVARTVALLRGRARYVKGRWIESPYGLVMVRKHPNRRGNQLLLTPEGHQLIRMYFGADALPSTATPVQPGAALP